MTRVTDIEQTKFKMARESNDKLFVAAIDFGTTFSGYAFSSYDDFKNDPLKIVTNVWNSGGRTLMSNKTPTALLLTPEKGLHSFGYEAENKYCELAEEGEEYKDWYYFHRFKMILHHEEKLNRNTMLNDETKKPLEAKKVFAMSIKYLKDHLFQSMKDKIPDIRSSDICYVITVPAIWSDGSKQFMREAALEAGITNDQLKIALEPEAASIYCQHLPTEREKIDGKTSIAVAKDGKRYMVVDLGGGTADITVHERYFNGSLRELRQASGGALGGKSIDDAYVQFLEDILGPGVIDRLKLEYMEDFIDLMRELETKKRAMNKQKSGKINMSIPVQVLDIMKECGKCTKIEDALSKSKYANKIYWNRSKLQIPVDIFRELFYQTINGIVEHIEQIYKEPRMDSADTILMVGGFSECELVHQEIKKRFSDKKVIVPDDAGLSVLKGAVIYGHSPRAISARVARRTYGIQSWPQFREGIHPPSKRVMINGVPRCRDVFFKYVEIGQQIEVGHRISQIFMALTSSQDFLECTVYTSTSPNPQFVDDPSCTHAGILRVPFENRDKEDERREIEETMVFGETELRVIARDLSNGRLYQASLEFLAT